MRKKLIIIVILCFVVIGILFIPMPHTSTVTLYAVKFDSSGKEVGRVDIPLEYTVKESVFKQELVRVSLRPFDGYTAIPDFTVTNRAKNIFSDYLSITVAVGELSGDLPTPDNPTLDSLQANAFRYILKVDEDCGRWMIRVQNADSAEEYFYVASISGDDTAQELLEYFNFTPSDSDTGMNTTGENINWNLHGIWMTADGIVQDGQTGVDFSVSGALPTKFEPYSTVELALNFTWPDCSIMQDDNKSAYTGHAQLADKHDNQRLYHIAAWLYDPAKNDSTSISFTICPEEGFVVVKLGQDYLVASTDSEADPVEILAFYKEYVHVSE